MGGGCYVENHCPIEQWMNISACMVLVRLGWVIQPLFRGVAHPEVVDFSYLLGCRYCFFVSLSFVHDYYLSSFDRIYSFVHFHSWWCLPQVLRPTLVHKFRMLYSNTEMCLSTLWLYVITIEISGNWDQHSSFWD